MSIDCGGLVSENERLREENRYLIADRAANEKANIESRRSICEQRDRYLAERDGLQEQDERNLAEMAAMGGEIDRLRADRDAWRCEAIQRRRTLINAARGLMLRLSRETAELRGEIERLEAGREVERVMLYNAAARLFELDGELGA